VALRRLRGEPVARILGRKEFYGLSFVLNEATLIPRPETELLVDLALLALKPIAHPDLLDLGTGTGCIAISVLANNAAAEAVATDLSPEALVAARANALAADVAERLTFAQGSWFVPLGKRGRRFDLIVSNPPYIESRAIDGLEIDVRRYDPRLALDGGPDGLDPYREIAAEALHWLKPKGALMVEIGSTQGESVPKVLEEAGFSRVTVEKDLAGLDRAAIGHHA
jgi:release factor glutamine methyltransferase